ncbi:hypothetical protein [Listeria valentina]|uniref:hypothetical protein n=1 Tax=Listeria valentina TaxID=2705293 RepID=UPI001431207E|nr:hypothetical protein [Listeria valentina]
MKTEQKEDEKAMKQYVSPINSQGRKSRAISKTKLVNKLAKSILTLRTLIHGVG